MLNFDPTERIDVPTSLQHPWLSAYHDPEDEPDCPEVFDKWRDIEKLQTMDEFREALWNEIEDYRREVRGLDIELSAFPPMLASSPLVRGMEGPEVKPARHEAETPQTVSAIMDSAVVMEEPVSMESTVAEPEPPKKSADLEPLLEEGDMATEAIHPIGDHHRRSITTPTDPVVTYARRSSILQPSRQGSTYSSPLPSSYVPSFVDGANQSDKAGGSQGTVAFPSQGYVFPARSRTGSTAGGEVTRRLLRTLSTVSIHESVEGLPGGLAGIAPIGKFITQANTEADAPPSEVPRDFGIRSDADEGDSETCVGKKRFVVG